MEPISVCLTCQGSCVTGSMGQQPGLNRHPSTRQSANPWHGEYMVRTLTALLEGGYIAYVKWDFNRSLSEVGSAAWPKDRQGEVAHRSPLLLLVPLLAPPPIL